MGSKLPSYEEVARYVYFTETSQNFDATKVDKATGKSASEEYELLSALFAEQKGRPPLDVAFLENLKDKNPRKVIYCEKVWVHREIWASSATSVRCSCRSI